MEHQDSCAPKLTVRQWHGKLFDELDFSGLDSWTLELADTAHWLLAKYHDVFSLDPMELGCTHSTEHTMKVMDDSPLRNDLGRSACLWLRRFKIICERRWRLVLSGLVRVHGSMLWYW